MKKVSKAKAKATVTARERLESSFKEEYIQDKMDSRICVPKPKAPKPNEPLIQFVVKKVNGQPRKVGVLVARHDFVVTLGKESGVVRLGWSRANFRKGDRFDKGVALNIALGRTHASEFTPICHSFRKDMQAFSDRCMRYFKGVRAVDKITIAPQTPKKPVNA